MSFLYGNIDDFLQKKNASKKTFSNSLFSSLALQGYLCFNVYKNVWKNCLQKENALSKLKQLGDIHKGRPAKIKVFRPPLPRLSGFVRNLIPPPPPDVRSLTKKLFWDLEHAYTHAQRNTHTRNTLTLSLYTQTQRCTYRHTDINRYETDRWEK